MYHRTCIAAALGFAPLAVAQVTTGNVQIVPAPTSVANNAAIALDCQVFAEQSAVLLTGSLAVDLVGDGAVVGSGTGVVPEGAVVSSYFLHLDGPGTSSLQADGTITFPKPVLAAITATTRLNATDGLFGAAGTIYPTGTEPLRGFESGAGFHNDGITIAGNVVTLDMGMASAVDQARILVLESFPASYTPFGSGCAGTNGTPGNTAVAPPRLGQPLDVTIDNLPAPELAVVTFGTSSTMWSSTPLPFDLAAFGAPNCLLLASPDVSILAVGNAGAATVQATMPANAAYVGETLFTQGFVLDPAANALGITTSNAATAVIGW